MIVPANQFLNKQANNNKNILQATRFQNSRENAYSPSNLMMTYSAPLETFRQEEPTESHIEDAPVNGNKKT